jgi:hypothetical protein
MHRWKCTEMVWDFEPDLRTVIPVTDSERLDRKEFHTLRSIHATSFPHRQGDISFQIFRRNVGPTNQRSNIHNTLFSAASGAGAPQPMSLRYSSRFVVTSSANSFWRQLEGVVENCSASALLKSSVHSRSPKRPLLRLPAKESAYLKTRGDAFGHRLITGSGFSTGCRQKIFSRFRKDLIEWYWSPKISWRFGRKRF